MKPGKQQEKEMMKAYNAYWAGYLKGDIKKMASLLAKEYTQVGSAESEVFFSKKDAVRFLRDTINQVAGKLEMRNRNIYIDRLDDLVLVNELADIYVLINKDSAFYSRFRVSTLMKKKKEGWKIIHQHSSFPDARTDGGENIAIEKIAEENRELREAVKRRTIELEEKNRGLEIEAALEKVRAIAMGMKEPAAMLEVCKTISLQLESLGVGEIRNVQTAIIYEEKGTYMNYEYYAKHDKSIITETSFTNHQMHKDFAAQMLKGKGEFFSTHIRGKKKLTDWIAYQKTTNVYIDTFLETTKSLSYYWFSLGPVALGISTYHPLTDDDTNLFKRFISVFELSYRRYLDIEKAEAQAKEVQIELVLERVRARTMAMQKSDELADTSFLLFQQFKELGETSEQISIGILKEDEKIMELYSTWYGSQWKEAVKVDMDEPVVMKKIYAAWKEKKKSLVIDLAGNDLRQYNAYRKKLSNLSYEERRWVIHIAFFSKGALTFSTTEPHPQETISLLERFAGVFDGTYTRFLDLKTAEAQAREAKIEAALERVRSKTMAMHKSDDLLDVIQVLSQQFLHLDFRIGAATFALNYKESNDFDLWLAVPDRSYVTKIHVPYFDHPLFHNFIVAKEKGLDFFVQNLSLEEKNSYFEHFFKTAPGSSEEEMKWVYNSKGYSGSEVLMKSISLGIANLEAIPYSEEENSILKRFAAAFEQSYVRFLDLQTAEAQAREAKIEAAMEKVRARAMAMQKAVELAEVAQVLRKEMGLLGVEELETSSIYIHDEVSGTTECWYAIQDIREQDKKLIMDHMTINLNDTWVGREMLNFYSSGQKQTSILMQGENRKEWINYCAQHSNMLQGYYGDVIPERTYHLLKFSNGYMGAASPGDISAESWELLKRATSVFSLAYTRFNDLQLAEANAKEAVKQSALDRVRAEIASMRSISDLAKITPLIWNELTVLGIPFIRCGVFIMDESQQLIHTFLSTPDGKAIAAFHLPYETPGNIGKALRHWRDKKNYVDHWNESAFFELASILLKQGAIASTEQYLSTIPPGGFYLHFLPFLQGMLYVGNFTQLAEDDIRLIQSVADTFSTAYARYEDFSNLEAAKKTVEKTLFDLKQAQTQLVQAEKMASLGQLTAGIAHEIQNPLNFVNNFSEVSNELIEEMSEEIIKGNFEEVKNIASDVKQNLEKINHHGKRADAIVKGMLQHSRSSTGQKEPTDINSLADEYTRLCFHGLRAKDKSFNATIKTDFDITLEKIDIIPQDIGRAILNLLTNAFYAVDEKKKKTKDNFEPTVSITTKKMADNVLISVMDNGDGIPEKSLDKIFQPFFTTKPTGQGTGLGLSLSYDIIKGHGGEIKVETKEGEGSNFVIQLPV